MTFGFFDDYFATDSSAVNATSSTPTTVTATVSAAEKSLNEIAKTPLCASDNLKENQSAKSSETVIKQEQIALSDKKESHIAVTPALNKTDQHVDDAVSSTDEEMGQ